jgi:hypothetical protein
MNKPAAAYNSPQCCRGVPALLHGMTANVEPLTEDYLVCYTVERGFYDTACLNLRWRKENLP